MLFVAFGAESVAEFGVGVRFDVGFELGPGAFVVADLAAVHADRQRLFERFDFLHGVLQFLDQALAVGLDLLAFGDVARDAENADEIAVLVAVDALGRLKSAAHAVDDFGVLVRLGFAEPEHFLVVPRSLPGDFFGQQLVIGFAEDMPDGLADKPRAGLVDEQVAKLLVLDEDRVARAVDDRPQQAEIDRLGLSEKRSG